MSHANLGRDLLDRAAALLEEKGVVERPPLLESEAEPEPVEELARAG